MQATLKPITICEDMNMSSYNEEQQTREVLEDTTMPSFVSQEEQEDYYLGDDDAVKPLDFGD